jgi:hypothetical protein
MRILHLEESRSSDYYKICIKCGYSRLLGDLRDYDFNEWTFSEADWRSGKLHLVNCHDPISSIIIIMRD